MKILEEPTETIPSAQPSSSAGYQPTQDEIDEYNQEVDGESPLAGMHPHHLQVSQISLYNSSLALDRAEVSDRMGSYILTALLKDLKKAGIDTGVVLDRSKVIRERAKARKTALAAMRCKDLLKCLSFDGKKEEALTKVYVNDASRNVLRLEEHVTMLKEPGSFFIGYTAPNSAHAAVVSRSKIFWKGLIFHWII